MKKTSFFQKALLIVYHPIDCLDIIKREKGQFSLLPVLVLYALAALMNYLYVFIVEFSLATKKVTDASLVMEAAMVAVPLFSFVVAGYAMTAIMSGESHFTELLTASAYALVPYILLTPLLGAFSNVVGYSGSGVYQVLRYIALFWTLALLFLSLNRLNDYGFWKTVGVGLLSLAAMAIMWAVLLLLFSMTIQLMMFFVDIAKELSYKYILS